MQEHIEPAGEHVTASTEKHGDFFQPCKCHNDTQYCMKHVASLVPELTQSDDKCLEATGGGGDDGVEGEGVTCEAVKKKKKKKKKKVAGGGGEEGDDGPSTEPTKPGSKSTGTVCTERSSGENLDVATGLQSYGFIEIHAFKPTGFAFQNILCQKFYEMVTCSTAYTSLHSVSYWHFQVQISQALNRV